MAELIRTQGFRTQVQNVPGAATPSVSFGQRRPEIAFQAQANYQNNIAQAIDRMSNTLFGLSEAFGQEAGQQYVAENRVTQQQLKDMVAGKVDPDLVSGSPMNVFSAAVRKARAIEVSGHVLAEGRRLATDLMIQAEQGQVDTQTASSNLTSFMDNAGSSLAQIDPDASLRFRANMATIGSAVIDKVAQVELARRQATNRAKMDLSYQDTLKGINAYLTQEDPNIDVFQVISAIEEAFYNEAGLMISPEAANGYRAEFRRDIDNLMISAVNRELIDPKYMANTADTFRRIATGDLDKVRQVTGYLMTNRPEAMTAIASNFRSMISDNINLQNQQEITRKRENEVATNNGMIEYFAPGTPAPRKREIVLDLARRGALTIPQMEQYLDQSRKEGDPYAFADIKTRVINGEITTPQQLRAATDRAGMNGTQYTSLNDVLLQGYSKQRADAERLRRKIAGVPDVSSTFATKDQQHLIDKDLELNRRIDKAADDFRQKNPDSLVPWESITLRVVDQYNKSVGADAQKQKATKELEGFVLDELRAKKKVKEGFVIDNNTSIDDLISRGILSNPNDIEYVRKRIEILRRVQATPEVEVQQ
jgi:hypothetical protein